jgi:hypothetical protein
MEYSPLEKIHGMAWFGHVNRHNSLAKTILQGTVNVKQALH